MAIEAGGTVTDAYTRILDNLADWDPKPNGPNRVRARCPAHDGKDANLAVAKGRDGALLKCFSHDCAPADILTAIGLTEADMFDNKREITYGYSDGVTVHRGPGKKFTQSGPKEARTAPVKPLYIPAGVDIAAAIADGIAIALVEGEKDADTIWLHWGIPAVSGRGGGRSFAASDLKPLTGAHIVAIPDQDKGNPEGKPTTADEWTKAVHASIGPIAATLSWRRPPDGHKDASDCILAGLAPNDLIPYLPAALNVAPDHDEDILVVRKVRLTSAAEIKPRPVRWLWDGRLALGTLGLLAGREGIGKSTCAYWLAGRITRGSLDGEMYGTPKAVLIAATEDSWEHTIVPRLMVNGADLTKVYRIDVEHDGLVVGLSLPRDLIALEEAALSVEAGLLILDPLMSRLGSLDTHKDAEVRQALEPLVAIADRAKFAIIGLIHHNKSGSGDPLNLVMGSKAFTAVARSVHTVAVHPDDEDQRVFGTPKNNLGRSDLPSLSFHITGASVETDEGTAWTGRLVWGEAIEESITSLLQRQVSGEERTERDEAAEWLRDFLESEGGSATSTDCKRKGKVAGHSERTLKRAAQVLRVQVESSGFPRRTTWSLPHDNDMSLSQSGLARGGKVIPGPTTTTWPHRGKSGPVGPVGPGVRAHARVGPTDDVPPDDEEPSWLFEHEAHPDPAREEPA